MNRYDEAEKLYYDSIKIVESLLLGQKEKTKIMAYKTMISYRKMNLGVLYKDTNRLSRAKQLFEESLSLATEVENVIGISKISGNLGQLYLQIGGEYIAQSEELFKRSLNISIEKQNDISTQYSKMNMGILEFHKKRYMEAGRWFSDIFENHKNIDYYVKEITLSKLEEILRLINKHEVADKIKKMYNNVQYQPKDILFLLDNSGSMQGSSIEKCKKNIKNIIINKLDDTDTISLTTFNNHVVNVFANLKKINIELIERQINSIFTDGGTAFYDALCQHIHTPNKWIVALTDGEDNGSQSSPQNVILKLKKVKTNLIIITVGTLPTRLIIKSICDNASLSGFGLLVEISTNPQDIDKAFAKVSKILRGELHVESL
jgi:tetratricopeptide (TPR) repeat protein